MYDSTPSWKIRARRFAVAMAALMLSATIHAATPSSPKLFGVLMYADWCNSCKVLDPKLQSVKQEFEQSGILFIRFDLTNERTTHQSGMLAQALGMGELFDKNAGKTGYLALVDRATGRTVEKITKTQSEQEIRAILRQAATK
jgi:thiol-disulfide isomerase/thioredoxin